jgi:hypothetical protein
MHKNSIPPNNKSPNCYCNAGFFLKKWQRADAHPFLYDPQPFSSASQPFFGDANPFLGDAHPFLSDA